MNVSLPNPAADARPAVAPAPTPPACLWQGHMAEDGGSTFGPIPCATLSATTEELCLRGTRGEFHVPRPAVIKIGRGKLYPWFFRAVQIHHRLSGISRELQFKPVGARLRDVVTELRALGYPVD